MKRAAANAIATSTAATTTDMSAKNKRQRIPAPTKRALELAFEPSSTDVNGSYTGVPKNKKEVPVQDADDL